MEPHILSLILFTPLAGALVVALLRRDASRLIKTVGLLFSLAALGLSVWLFLQFDGTNR